MIARRLFMRLSIDPHADALYLRLREGRVGETRPLLDHRVIVDFDENGQLLGVEVLGIDCPVDRSGYAHVDVAITTSEGRVIEMDREEIRTRDIARPRS